MPGELATDTEAIPAPEAPARDYAAEIRASTDDDRSFRLFAAFMEHLPESARNPKEFALAARASRVAVRIFRETTPS